MINYTKTYFHKSSHRHQSHLAIHKSVTLLPRDVQRKDHIGKSYSGAQVAHSVLVEHHQVHQLAGGPVNGSAAQRQKEVNAEDAIALVDNVQQNKDTVQSTHLP